MPSRNGYVPYDTGNFFPGVIATVEQHDVGGAHCHRSYEARIYGKTGYFASYDEAVEWCLQEKRIAAWYEEQLRAARERGYMGVMPTIDEGLGA